MQKPKQQSTEKFAGQDAVRFAFVKKATFRQHKAGLPKRATRNSAGYDFTLSDSVTIPPGETVTFGTGIKAYMPPGVVLFLFVRSSIGIKRGIILANGTGVIDADYADNPTNEGEISAALRNTTDAEVTLHSGERCMQGVFVPFLVTDDDNATAERNGGIGSTNNAVIG